MTARLFSIIGDADIRRNMTGLNIGSREAMKTAQVIDFLGLNPLAQALQEVRPESSIIIFAGLTQPILMSGDCGTISASVDPSMSSISGTLSSFCVSHPDVQVHLITLRVSVQAMPV